MLFWITIRSAIQSLWANKLRSLLAMLGIIIGVGAVIAMLALGAGTQAKVIADLEAMGTNLMIVSPAPKGSGGVISGTQQNLTVDDALAMRELPGIVSVTPGVSGSVQAKYMNHNTRTSIQGVASTYFEIRNFPIEKGRLFTEAEEENLARVAVLGPATAVDLFGPDNPLGAIIKINGINFKVVGIMKGKGDQGWYNPDDQIIVPFTTAMKILLGLKYVREIDMTAEEGVDQVQLSGQPQGTSGFPSGGYYHDVPPPPDSVVGVLRKRHHQPANAPDDVRVRNQTELIARRSEWVWTFRVLLGSIAGISLLVGGIGIMNIMLVTVTERTREIGTRKAIGAKRSDILLQFLIEAVIMAAMGGTLGAGFGIGLAKALPMIPMFSTFLTIVQPIVVVGSIGVAAGVGICSGLYPAFRASRLDPIEALRYE